MPFILMGDNEEYRYKPCRAIGSQPNLRHEVISHSASLCSSDTYSFLTHSLPRIGSVKNVPSACSHEAT